MNNIEELFIANAELAAELLQHMADNEIDSDYFAVVTDSPNCGREVQSEHSVTEVALMAAGIIEQLIAQLEAAQKELSAANEKLKGEPVPVGTVGDEMRGYANRCFVVYSDADLEEGDELFTAPQTPIVLPEELPVPDMRGDEPFKEALDYVIGWNACIAAI
ncbi:TPA: hypothetical protein ACJ75O_004533, partial [Yersinia enterocolitica]|nr:hypothetical protein [Yersinia enterocolitica]